MPMPIPRPSTSGGRRLQETTLDRRRSRDDLFLGAQLKNTAAFDKRVSRDDMYLGNHSTDARSAAFHVPLRSQTVTLVQGPDMTETAPTHLSPVPSDEQIGMALGSPVHSPIQSYGQRQPQQSHWPQPSSFQASRQTAIPGSEGQCTTTITSNNGTARPEGSAPNPTIPPSTSMQRSKSTRRKLLGFFGSKRQADAKAVPMPMPVPPPMPAPITGAANVSKTSLNDGSSAAMAAAVASPSMSASQASVTSPKTLERSTTRGRNHKHQPIVVPLEPASLASINTKASNAAVDSPLVDAQAASGLKSSPSFRGKRPFLRSKASEPAIRKRPEVPAFDPGLVAPSNLASPYLNVEIPEASMERYSVMFGCLLDCNSSASSLLARRQATVNRLKTINHGPNGTAADGLLQVGGLQRRATSPSITKSPSHSQFPAQSSGISRHQHTLSVNAGPPPPRIRSNTSPAVAQSPMQPEFDMHRRPAQPPPQLNPRHAPPLSDNPCGVARKVMPTERPAASFDTDRASMILESPTEMTSPVDNCVGTAQDYAAFRPVIREPQWQMVSPPSTSSSHGSGTSKLAKDSATTSPASEISVDLQVDEPDSALKSAVEISIARQISISRQQRDMLRPLKAGNTRGGASSTPGLARAATLKLGRNEWLQETRAATPTLVLAEPEASYSYGSGSNAPSQPGRDQNEQNLHNLSPRSNANGAGSLHAYQMAQNRKSEQVILEAA